MLSDFQTRHRSLVKTARALTRCDGDRYLDWSIELRIVEQDLEHGVEALQGKPPLVLVRDTVRIGGWLDTVRRRIVSDSDARALGLRSNPLIWYAGPKQADILLREPGEFDPTRVLLYSAEGGGKTFLLGQWTIVQVIRAAEKGLRGYAGCTAPVDKRVSMLMDAIKQCVPIDSILDRDPRAWGTHYVADKEFRFASGITLQFRATKRQSAATGSPIQGYTWLWSTDDELQDTMENGADPDIEARLRGAKTSYRMASATAKDSPSWRSFRDGKEASPDWLIERIRYTDTPFVWPEHWVRMQRNMSAREWQRRGEALDVAPERAVYHEWQRDRNLRRIPNIGARDVTASVLSKWGRRAGVNFDILIGHDPGSLWDVSVLLKAYEIRGIAEPVWFVVGEVNTRNNTTEHHVLTLLHKLRTEWKCNILDRKGNPDPASGHALVRCDPHGTSDSKTQKDVYQVFRDEKVHILSAAFRKGKASNSQVPKQPRIDMVNGLLGPVVGEPRLYVACDEHRQPLAPKLVAALEQSEYNEAGKAEADKKDERDVSHWPAALGYALWALERRIKSGVTQGRPS